MTDLQVALDDLRKGKPLFIYDADGREEETDIVFASEKVTHENVRFMRKNGGGLICVTVSDKIAGKVGLPFLVDVFRSAEPNFPLLKKSLPDHLPYDAKSAFSITFNHRKCFTGITDRDRALTISEFGKLVRKLENGSGPEKPADLFTGNFRIPGHVFLLRTSKELLKDRNGHTELSTAMCVMAGLPPSATICEMMGDDGNALSREKAREYAESKSFLFLEGIDIIDEWRSRCE